MNNIELIADALNYIEVHLNDEITVDLVANACYCSKSNLQKLFRCLSGYGVKEYIIKRRLTRAARELIVNPSINVLEIAVKYGYSSHESFTRAFEQVWNCQPSVFRKESKFTDICPRLMLPMEKGDTYMRERKHVDITELYDVLKERKDCYIVCCDIKSLVPINEISRKAGDMAILETAKRMEQFSGVEDFVFRIGGDEFVLLTNSNQLSYAEGIVEQLRNANGQAFLYEHKEIPLSLHIAITKYDYSTLKYDELFISLHSTIRDYAKE